MTNILTICLSNCLGFFVFYAKNAVIRKFKIFLGEHLEVIFERESLHTQARFDVYFVLKFSKLFGTEDGEVQTLFF